MKLSLAYTDMTITVHTNTLEATCNAIQIAGQILEELHELGYGDPQLKMEHGEYCVKCHKEIPANSKNCPHCLTFQKTWSK